jgi:hypothetical protein
MITIGCVPGMAQSPQPQNTPIPQAPQPQNTPIPQAPPSQRDETLRQIREQQQRNRELDRFANTGPRNPYSRITNPLEARQSIEKLYRKPTERELKSLAPLNDDLQKYADFLRTPNTGLIRLAADFGCTVNNKVVVASDDCLKYSMPGNGISYSFREKIYRVNNLADITFTGDSFQATGFFLHGILAAIGNIDLRDINLRTNGFGYLVNFQPATDFQRAVEIDKELFGEVKKDGFIYSRTVPVAENMTYVLRSIAYRGTVYKALQGLVYNELDFDKRKDIVVAFRLVRRHEDGSVTILWKELLRRDSPKIKLPVKKSAKTIKENKFTAKSVQKDEFRK